MRSWNVGTVSYMLWVGVGCLLYAINAIVWRNHVDNVSTFWAYFSTRTIQAAAMGVLVSSLTINRRLYQISKVSTVTVSPDERRRHIITDVALCTILPIIWVVLQYVNSCNRYDIYEEIGPINVGRVTIVWVFTQGLPPVIISAISAVYCALSIYQFNQRRAQFAEMLSAQSGLSANRYFRIMGLAGVELIAGLVASIVRMADVIRYAGIQPYISWDHIHNNYNDIDKFRSFYWRSVNGVQMEYSRWSFVMGAIIFFLFFGFAEEARKNYSQAFNSVVKFVGHSKNTLLGSRGVKSSVGNSTFDEKCGNGSMGRTATLPVFVRKETHSKRDSFDSMSDITDPELLDEKHITSTFHSASTHTFHERSASPISIPPLPELAIDEKPRVQPNSHDMV